ncbi:AAA family ATPase [Bradyrhizobium sp. 38]|uniref:adenylate/guanylate cyclase domain-containing protein n=1 Tax=unclassified Bradyrhizobium TaxID=2631580 RepID=UPI001FF80C57|nr:MULTISPECIES: adenylate/guanylate cyclase domain-containing protein [unclassified Bradyrhizobium]MCK1341664.1 AAA family ATPase [Bradyrhizobium sp. 38]MCK1779687.1 AAA family ATPase [Bradyrhizobium sp. 132]
MDISAWLRGLGLECYGQAFRENAIDEATLPKLTAEDLRELGVTTVGHRRILLDAIAALRAKTLRDPAEHSVEPDRARGKAPEAERRQLTVMFADLVGSTALSARLDPEDLRDIIGAYHRRCAQVITRSGGFVAKYLGDGVLAYFGYPKAHEEDAEQAVRAGLALIDAVAKLNVGQATSLQVRVGIATGLVVVGDLLGEGAAQEQAVIGETPNLAARLQALAEPDTVIIADDTRRLLGGLFDYRDRGTLPIAGIDYPVQLWRVVGPSLVGSRFEALRANRTPLIGREEEIALLTRRWERAKTGDGSVVLIAGEPGIGKSRIAQTLLEQLGKEPHTQLRYFCSPHHQHSAHYPSITQLEQAAGFRREDTAETRLDKLVAVLALANKELSEAIPLLADLLSIPTGDRYAPLNLTPQKRKEKTLQVHVAQVECLAERQPLLMLWEDIHWSDPTTLESLDLLIDRAATLRVLMILTFRPEFTPPWVGRPHVTLLSLNRLPPRERAEMIVHVTGGKTLPGAIAEQIIDRTDGVPLFIEELTKSVVESGSMTDNGDHYSLAGPVVPLAIPTTLQASLLARLDRLAPTREVVQIAATLGRQFSYELISAVADMQQLRLEGALEQLIRAELVFRRGTPPDATYIFKHALVQDAAYSTLLRPRRQQLHGRIATTLERQFPEIVAAQPELMAQHCALGGLVEKAIEFWDKAGRLAVERSTMAEAAAHFGKALTLLARLPKSPQRRSSELSLQLALAGAVTAAKGWASPQAGEAYARARELCREDPEGAQLARALAGAHSFLHNRAEIRAAHQLAEEAAVLSEHRNDSDIELITHRCLGVSLMFRGEYNRALHHLRQSLGFYNEADHRPPKLTPHDVRVTCESFVAWTVLLLGKPDQALAESQRALAWARELLQPYTLAFALHVNCVFHQLRGDATILEERADELVPLATEHGFPHFMGTGTCFRGWAILATGGSIEEAISRMRRGLATKRATGAEIKVPYYLGLLAEAHRRANRPADGIKLLDEALELVERTDERWYEAELHRLMAEMLITKSDRRDAERWLYGALRTAQKQDARLWELRAGTSLARLWRDQGKRTDAHDLLAPIYRCFTEGLDTADLKEAAALLAELA